MKRLFRVLDRVHCQCSPLRQNLYRYYSGSSNEDATDKPTDNKKPSLQSLLKDAALGVGPLDEVSEEDEWRTSPYPKGSALHPNQSQSAKSLRPEVDPRNTTIIMFPGYGSQHANMGRGLLKYPAARDIFDACCDILEYDIVKLLLKGSIEKLNQLKYAEPAIFACSLAALEKLKEERPWAIENCVATAGFGVGEITALTFAGAFKFGDALKLVRTRAQAIEMACEMAAGGMVTVNYRPDSRLKEAMIKAKEWCSDRGIDDPQCQVAVYLNPNTKIISGHKEALRYIECNKDYFKLDSVIRLPVKGAFHSKLMLPAAEQFRIKIRKMEILEPLVTVHTCVSGQYYKHEKEIGQILPKQIHAPIKWEQMLHILYEREPTCNFPDTVICGPTNNLSDYLRKVNSKAADFVFHVKALEFIESNVSKFKLKRVERLNVPGAFQTNLIKPAADTFKSVLGSIELSEPSTLAYSNVDCKAYRKLDTINEKLPKHICKPMMWEQLIHKLYDRERQFEYPDTFACGPQGRGLKTAIAAINMLASKQCIAVLN